MAQGVAKTCGVFLTLITNVAKRRKVSQPMTKTDQSYAEIIQKSYDPSNKIVETKIGTWTRVEKDNYFETHAGGVSAWDHKETQKRFIAVRGNNFQQSHSSDKIEMMLVGFANLVELNFASSLCKNITGLINEVGEGTDERTVDIGGHGFGCSLLFHTYAFPDITNHFDDKVGTIYQYNPPFCPAALLADLQMYSGNGDDSEDSGYDSDNGNVFENGECGDNSDDGDVSYNGVDIFSCISKKYLEKYKDTSKVRWFINLQDPFSIASSAVEFPPDSVVYFDAEDAGEENIVFDCLQKMVPVIKCLTADSHNNERVEPTEKAEREFMDVVKKCKTCMLDQWINGRKRPLEEESTEETDYLTSVFSKIEVPADPALKKLVRRMPRPYDEFAIHACSTKPPLLTIQNLKDMKENDEDEVFEYSEGAVQVSAWNVDKCIDAMFSHIRTNLSSVNGKDVLSGLEKCVYKEPPAAPAAPAHPQSIFSQALSAPKTEHAKYMHYKHEIDRRLAELIKS